jgi:hypothetical protein
MLTEAVLGLRPERRERPGPRIVNIADSDNEASKRVSQIFGEVLCARYGITSLADARTAGEPGPSFEGLVRTYLEHCLGALPAPVGGWRFRAGGSIADYAQYRHLRELKRLSDEYEELRVHLGTDYLIRPDVLVYRDALADASFGDGVVEERDGVAGTTFLRSGNRERTGGHPLLHASISCKWTLRSDRAQNARTEALNLIRNRKGRVPVISVVTAEPMPSRLASLADGTGDVDRVYHVALYELQEAVDRFVVEKPGMLKWKHDLHRMVRGLRLADISDLPVDLLI